jgi:DNA-binding CsgD family transcriptional regulator
VGGLDRFRHHLDGRETFDGRWVPGLLALYTELGVQEGVRRSLRELMKRDLDAHVFDAQWPMELAFMAEGALALGDVEIAEELRPFLARFQGMNVIGGQFIAPFGSADRFLGRIAALVGEPEQAEGHFAIAEAMDRRMGAVIHEAETLAHWSGFLAARDPDRSHALARRAREMASKTGQKRVLRLLGLSGPGLAPDGLSEREMEVLRLLAEGLSNKEIAESLFISANTAANHVRSILMKTGSANRTQAAIYASDHKLV